MRFELIKLYLERVATFAVLSNRPYITHYLIPEPQHHGVCCP